MGVTDGIEVHRRRLVVWIALLLALAALGGIIEFVIGKARAEDAGVHALSSAAYHILPLPHDYEGTGRLPPGGGDGHVHSGHVLQQHHEFVPAEAGRCIDIAAAKR